MIMSAHGYDNKEDTGKTNKNTYKYKTRYVKWRRLFREDFQKLDCGQ